jgi:hypothetical protein
LLSGLGGRGRILSIVRRSPITLDNAVFAVIALWTLAATSLFASTPDAVNNQPLRIWVDADRFVSNPLEVVSYLLQFTIVAGLLWGFYWINRYVLIRRVLHKEGWIALAFASLATWIVYTPLAGQLILFLPLNPPHWSLLPSENHNPFDTANYGFTFILWATITPVILASERLLAERSEAMGRHAQVRAELQVLQQQINPHFLFNSLNTVYVLCLKNSAASAEALSNCLIFCAMRFMMGRRNGSGLMRKSPIFATISTSSCSALDRAVRSPATGPPMPVSIASRPYC